MLRYLGERGEIIIGAGGVAVPPRNLTDAEEVVYGESIARYTEVTGRVLYETDDTPPADTPPADMPPDDTPPADMPAAGPPLDTAGDTPVQEGEN